MTTVRIVARNTGIVLVGNIIFRVISLIIIIYLARYLGKVDFGKYSFVFAYLAFFGIITDLGLQKILVREIARKPQLAPKLIGNAYIMRLALTIFAFFMSVIIITLMSFPIDTTTYVYIGAFALLFISFSDFYATIFEANLRMEYNVIARLAFKSIFAILVFWIISLHGKLIHIMIAVLFSEIVKTLLSYLFSRKFVHAKFEIDFGMWKFLIKESIPLALFSIIWIIHFRTDVVMLSIMTGDAQVGIYSAAYKLSEPLIFIPQALIVSLFPIMSASFITSKERLIKMYQLGIKYILMIMFPIAVGTTLIADRIVLLIYGTEFAASTMVLQILVWAIVFTSINIILSNLLVSINQQILSTTSIALGALLNIVLNFILIPLLSCNGAAIATVITKIVIFSANFYFVSKYLQILPLHRIFAKPLISGLVMGGFVYCFNNLNVFLVVLFGVIIYSTILLVLRTFSDEDVEIAKKILKFLRD